MTQGKRGIFKVVIEPWDERTKMSEDPVWVARAKFNDEFRNNFNKFKVLESDPKEVYVENRKVWDAMVPRWNSQEFQAFERRQVMFITQFTNEIPHRGDVMDAYLDVIKHDYGIQTVDQTQMMTRDLVIVHLPIEYN